LGKEEHVLVDNHQLIDPVEAKFSRDHPKHQDERKLLRNVVFESLVDDHLMRSRIIVFTGKMNSAHACPSLYNLAYIRLLTIYARFSNQ
jgi:hypothetical protein